MAQVHRVVQLGLPQSIRNIIRVRVQTSVLADVMLARMVIELHSIAFLPLG